MSNYSFHSLPPDEPEKLSVLALIGMVISIISVLVWMLAFLGLFFSLLALYQMNSEPRRGKGWAIGGATIAVMVLGLNLGKIFFGW